VARKALIIGLPGTGKSTSARTLDPKSTFIINVANKSLPFKGWRNNYTPITKENPEGNYFVTDQPLAIIGMLNHINEKMPHIQTVILDDYGYSMTFEYMRRAKEKGFERFSDIGQQAFLIFDKIDKMRDDVTVFVMGHPEVDTDSLGNKQVKLRTIGKMMDSYISIEGLFTVVLFTNVSKTGDTMDYTFVTQNTGSNTGKSPMGMFDSLYIPNDLETVRTKMIEYEN